MFHLCILLPDWSLTHKIQLLLFIPFKHRVNHNKTISPCTLSSWVISSCIINLNRIYMLIAFKCITADSFCLMDSRLENLITYLTSYPKIPLILMFLKQRPELVSATILHFNKWHSFFKSFWPKFLVIKTIL